MSYALKSIGIRERNGEKRKMENSKEVKQGG